MKHGADALGGVLGQLAYSGIHVTKDASALVVTAEIVTRFVHHVPQLVMRISVSATEVTAKENPGGVGLAVESIVFLNFTSFVVGPNKNLTFLIINM